MSVVPSEARPSYRSQGSAFRASVKEKADPFGKRRLLDDNLSLFLQTVKSLGFGAVYVMAEATTSKDSRALTLTLKPQSSNIIASRRPVSALSWSFLMTIC